MGRAWNGGARRARDQLARGRGIGLTDFVRVQNAVYGIQALRRSTTRTDDPSVLNRARTGGHQASGREGKCHNGTQNGEAAGWAHLADQIMTVDESTPGRCG
jgi:hypothetical protein